VSTDSQGEGQEGIALEADKYEGAIALLVLFAQRRIVSGLTAGSFR